MMRHLRTGLLLGLFAISAVARAVIIPVYVFNDDYSTEPPPGPIIDPIIEVGDTIEWRWLAPLHSVTSVLGSPESFNSGILDTGATFQHTFTQQGTFWYYCLVHGFDNGNGTAGGMAGTVTVVPEPSSLLAFGLIGLAALAARKRQE